METEEKVQLERTVAYSLQMQKQKLVTGAFVDHSESWLVIDARTFHSSTDELSPDQMRNIKRFGDEINNMVDPCYEIFEVSNRTKSAFLRARILLRMQSRTRHLDSALEVCLFFQVSVQIVKICENFHFVNT